MANPIQIRTEETNDLRAARSLGGVIIGTGALLTGAGMPASASIIEQVTNNHTHWVEKSDRQYRGVEVSPADTYNHIGMMLYPSAYFATREAPSAKSTYSSNVSIALLQQSTNKSHELATLIQSYTSLNVGWDGSNAEPLSQNTINEGLSFIELVLNFSETKPHVSPAGDGELSFAWETEDDYLEASFYGDGTLYWYSDIKGDKETDTFEFSKKSIPKSFMDKILNFEEQ